MSERGSKREEQGSTEATKEANGIPEKGDEKSVKSEEHSEEPTKIGLPPGFQEHRMRNFSGHDGETIHITDLTPVQTLLIRKCKNVEMFVSDCKCAKIAAEECDGLKLKIDAHVIAGILEINKCQDVQVRVHTYVPTVQIDQSKRVEISYDKASDMELMATHRCEDVTFTPNAVETYGGDKIPIRLPDLEEHRRAVEADEQFITRLVGGKFMTEVVLREGKSGYITTKREIETREEKIEEAITALSGLMKQQPIGGSGWIS